MNSATDTIRAMLDERGVEHRDNEDITRFFKPNGFEVVMQEGIDGKLDCLTPLHFTPAQAVEATLGSGESAKLRALVHDMNECIEHSSLNCDGCSLDKCNLYEFADRMRELGVDV